MKVNKKKMEVTISFGEYTEILNYYINSQKLIKGIQGYLQRNSNVAFICSADQLKFLEQKDFSKYMQDLIKEKKVIN